VPLAAFGTIGNVHTFPEEWHFRFGAEPKVEDAGLVNLRVLNFSENKITDAAVEHLKMLKNLRKLAVGSTGLIQDRNQRFSAGALALQAALPDLEIRRY